MDLILWRHAEAEDGGPDLPDAKRRLTPRGEKQARRVAKWFLQHRPKELRILVSPTERTTQTARALGQSFDVDERVGPRGDVESLLSAARWPDADGAVLLVGHQPVLGQLAAYLMARRPESWTIRKGGLWWFNRGASDRETILRVVVDPALI